MRKIPDAGTRTAVLRAEEIVGVMDLGALPPEQAMTSPRKNALRSAPGMPASWPCIWC